MDPVLVIGLILAAIALLLWLFASDILGGDDASPTPTLSWCPTWSASASAWPRRP